MPRKQFLISALDSCSAKIGGPRVNVGKTLARIPDDVVLSVCTRNIELGDPVACLCGWAVREELIRTTGEDDTWISPESEAAELFGGTQREWMSVFMGVICYDALPVIEQAWTERVDKAVARSAR